MGMGHGYVNRNRAWRDRPNAPIRAFERAFILGRILIVIFNDNGGELGGGRGRRERAARYRDNGGNVFAEEGLAEELSAHEACCAEDDEFHGLFSDFPLLDYSGYFFAC